MKGPRFESCVTLNVEMLSSALKIELLYVSVGELEKHFCSNYLIIFIKNIKSFFLRGLSNYITTKILISLVILIFIIIFIFTY